MYLAAVVLAFTYFILHRKMEPPFAIVCAILWPITWIIIIIDLLDLLIDFR